MRACTRIILEKCVCTQIAQRTHRTHHTLAARGKHLSALALAIESFADERVACVRACACECNLGGTPSARTAAVTRRESRGHGVREISSGFDVCCDVCWPLSKHTKINPGPVSCNSSERKC